MLILNESNNNNNKPIGINMPSSKDTITEDEEQPLLSETISHHTYLSVPEDSYSTDEESADSNDKLYNKLLESTLNIISKCPLSVLVILFVILILAVNILYLIKYADLLYVKSMNLNIEKLSVNDLTDSGVHFHMVSTVEFNYNKLTNYYHRYLLMSLSWISSITAIPIGIIPIFTSIQNDVYTHIFNLELQEQKFTINLSQNAINTVEVNNYIQPVSRNVAKLINDLSRYEDDVVRVNLRSKFDCSLSTSLFAIGKFPINYSQSINLNLADLIKQVDDGFTITDLRIQSSIDGSEYYGNASIIIPPFDFLDINIKPIKWDVRIPGCKPKEQVGVAMVTTDNAIIKPIVENRIPIEFKIPKISNRLSRKCLSKHYSPVNRLLVNFMEDTPILAFVSGDQQLEDESMSWFDNFIQQLDIQITLQPSKVICSPIKEPIKSLKAESIGIEIVNEVPWVSSSLEIGVGLPREIKKIRDVDIKSVKGEVSLHYEDMEVCSIEMTEWQVSELECDTLLFKIDVENSILDIENEEMLSLIVMQLIHGKSSTVELIGNIDVVVESPFLNTTLRSIDKSLNYTLSSKPLGKVIDNIDLKLNSIKFIDSKPHSLHLEADIALLNPFGITVDNMLDSVKVDIGFNGSSVGNLEFGGFILKAEEYTNLSTILTLDIQSESEKSKLEQLFGSYVSGNSPLINVKGSQNGVHGSESLSNVLSNLEIDMKMPQFTNDNEDADKDNTEESEKKPTTTSSIFLLDSTMHIMSSEIELTVYNPIVNHDVIVDIIDGKASYEDTTLAYVSKQQTIVIPPGIYKTPRIPVTYASGGLGADILKKAINGNLVVDTRAMLGVHLGEFKMELLFYGKGMDTRIRL